MTDQSRTTPTAETPLPQTGASPQNERPRLYVACLAAYNAGRLHGCWVDATTPEDISTAVSAMLRVSPEPDASEWAIHDFEGFEGAHISEWASFEDVCALADFITEHGMLGAKLHRYFGNDLEQARAAFDDYAGRFRSTADFADEITRESGVEIPKAFEYYIDWEAMARDMLLNGEIFVIELGFDEAHVFWSR